MLTALKNKFAQAAAVGTTALVPMAAFAQTNSTPPDFTALTDAVDLSTAGTAVLAIAGLFAVFYVIWKGAKLVLRMVKGA